jgi:hypothetical protein
VTRPDARTEALLTETVDDELLVYDLERDRAHCLTPAAAAVWRACDGERTPAQIARVAGLDEAVVAQALRELAEAHLLRAPARKKRGPSRRDVLVAAVVAPLVLSISVPAAAQAASCIGFRQPCTPGGVRCCGNRQCRRVGRFGFICQ